MFLFLLETNNWKVKESTAIKPCSIACCVVEHHGEQKNLLNNKIKKIFKKRNECADPPLAKTVAHQPFVCRVLPELGAMVGPPALTNGLSGMQLVITLPVKRNSQARTGCFYLHNGL